MALSETISLLEVLSPLLALVPVAGNGLVAMVGVAVQVCQSAESAKVNREAYEQLAREVAGYATAVSRATQSDPRFSSLLSGSQEEPDRLQETWMKDVDELAGVFGEVMEAINARQAVDDKRRGKFLGGARRLRYDISHKGGDEEQVKRLQRKMELCVRVFHIGTGIRGLGELERIKTEIHDAAALQVKKMEELAARQTQQIKDIVAPQAEGIQQIRDRQQLAFIRQELKPVPGSRFSEEGMPNGCLANTRMKILEQLQSWATDESESCPTVFGLTGPAGTGKTTVSISFCQHFDRLLPVINFLVSRTTADRRNPTKIVHTLSYQLGVREDKAQAIISGALQSPRDIMTCSLAEQIEELLITPLKAWEGSKRPILLVIDALDECDKIDGVEGGRLIPSIASAIRQLSGRVKLFITSREEPELRKMFKELGVDALKNGIRLQDIAERVVREDIVLYYQHHLRLIAKRRGFDHAGTWPSQADFDLLVARTGKLFVFAALVTRLLGNARVDPKQKLQEILHSPNLSTGSSALQSLDKLYITVLEKAVDSGDEALDGAVQERVHRLVGALVLLQAPLNIRTLSSLLGENVTLIRGDIDHLSAVLIIPDDDNAPIITFHPSFADCVIGRCPDSRFRVDPAVSHLQLLRRTLIVMDQHLRRDICNVEDPSVMNADIKDLEEKRTQYLPPELRYACEYWLVHLIKAGQLDSDIVKELNMFCERHLLHWIEVLSLLDKVSTAHVYLRGAIDRCRLNQDLGALTAMRLLEDIERVVETYDSPIRTGALQVYCSVLQFMPKCKLDEHAKHERMSTIELKTRRLENWSSVRRTLEGHTQSVTSIAYSPDGTRIASGSDDQTVRVWDSTTGGTLASFDGHTNAVTSVAFSADGMHVASGSYDQTVRVWDIITGGVVTRLDGHTSWVASVAFSPDGTRIASGSDDLTVLVWDAIGGRALVKLEGHTKPVTSVVFSADGTRIISGSKDKTLQVWDANTGAALAKFEGHTNNVTSVALSVDGTRIASGSYDQTVRVWDAVTGAVLANLTGHTATVTSVTFLANGMRIASGSWDTTVRVWNVVTGEALAKLEGHTGAVMSVAFSGNGTRIASGSEDQTVRVWDTTTVDAFANLDGHTDTVASVAFSADGTRIASSSFDYTVWVWDAITGDALTKLEGHSGPVRSVAFSVDRMRIVSGSDDLTVRVWDATTGRTLAKLEGHVGWLIFVAFSEDNTRIISRDVTGNQCLWDADRLSPLTDLDPYTTSPEPFTNCPPSVLSFNHKSGWLESKQSSDRGLKRLCWIPPDRRGEFCASGDTAVFFSTGTGGITLLSISQT